jgi:predicted RNA-binding Zn ribbon-like protein
VVTPSKVSFDGVNFLSYISWEKRGMAGSVEQREWVNGFLFVGNHLALDFLNTKPILESEPQELLTNAAALQQWLVASETVTSQKNKALMRAWRGSRRGEAFIRQLTAFRERLRAAVLRLEVGSLPGDAFLAEIDRLLKEHPQRTCLRREASKVALSVFFEPRKPEDVWAPIIAAVADLLTEVEPSRIRKCESESCVVHFYDTSKKGSRRWCSMNICGNRLKVAAYQRRRRQV